MAVYSDPPPPPSSSSPPPPELGVASEIASALLNGESPPDIEEDGFSIWDVQLHAQEFRNDLEVISAWHRERLPGLPIGRGRVSPVSLSTILGASWPMGVSLRGDAHIFFRDDPGYYLYFLDLALDRAEETGFKAISPDEARESFLTQATSFLATRLTAVRSSFAGLAPQLKLYNRIGGRRVSVPGCSYSVTTNSPGLRVFWSGAYYITGNYFGYPTTPAVSTLQAGTYVFGVDGGAYGHQIQWDTSAICSLPGWPGVHLNF